MKRSSRDEPDLKWHTKVILAKGDEDLRKRLAETLRAEGFTVIEAPNGLTLIETLASRLDAGGKSMDTISILPTSSRRSSRSRIRPDRRPKRPPSPDESHRTSHGELAGGLRFERRASGTAVTGPGIYVWDADHETAVSWAQELARALPSRRVRTSPPSKDR